MALTQATGYRKRQGIKVVSGNRRVCCVGLLRARIITAIHLESCRDYLFCGRIGHSTYYVQDIVLYIQTLHFYWVQQYASF